MDCNYLNHIEKFVQLRTFPTVKVICCCYRALRAYVPCVPPKFACLACLRALRAYVSACLRALRAYVLCVSTCLVCPKNLRAYHRALRALRASKKKLLKGNVHLQNAVNLSPSYNLIV